MLWRDLDKLFQLDLQPNRPCMMMIGGFCPPSAADSYEVYDILMGSSLALKSRRLSLSKHAMDRNDLELIMVATAEWDFGVNLLGTRTAN